MVIVTNELSGIEDVLTGDTRLPYFHIGVDGKDLKDFVAQTVFACLYPEPPEFRIVRNFYWSPPVGLADSLSDDEVLQGVRSSTLTMDRRLAQQGSKTRNFGQKPVEEELEVMRLETMMVGLPLVFVGFGVDFGTSDHARRRVLNVLDSLPAQHMLDLLKAAAS